MKEKLRKHNYKYEEFKSQLGSKGLALYAKVEVIISGINIFFLKTIECRKCGMIYLEKF